VKNKSFLLKYLNLFILLVSLQQPYLAEGIQSFALSNSTGNQNCDSQDCNNKCCNKKIKKKCPQQSIPLSVTRDGYGVPTIKGGTFEEVSFAVGKVEAEDRLFQVFQFVIASNGRIAEFFGAGSGNGNVNSDIFTRQINATDAEVNSQYNTLLTSRTKTFYQFYIQGLNAQVDFVNANPSMMPYELKVLGFTGNAGTPLPHFRLEDILRTITATGRNFSPSSIPNWQLTGVISMNSLIANPNVGNAVSAYEVFKDLMPIPQEIKTATTVVPNSDCPSIGNKVVKKGNKNDQITKADESIDNSKLNDHALLANATLDFLKGFEEVREQFLPTIGSYGAVFAGSKSASGNPLLLVGIQPNFNHPSDFYQVNIDSPSSGVVVTGNVIGVVIPTNGSFHTNAFTVHVGHLPANDYLYEPLANAQFLQNETVLVKQADGTFISVIFKNYRSSSGGWVIAGVPGAIPPPFGPAIPPPSIPLGDILTLRSVFVGKQLASANAFIETLFAKSIKQFIGAFLNPSYTSDSLGLGCEFADKKGNILAGETGWTKLPSSFDRRFPLGFKLASVIDNTGDANYVIKEPLLDVNTKQGYYTNWNTEFKQGAQNWNNSYRAPDRQYWINEYIRSFDKLTFEDAQRLVAHAANSQFNNGYRNGLNANASLFFLFKELFFNIVESNNPTPAQLQALAFLADFDGRWFEGDQNDVINGLDVSPKFLLANTWLTNVCRTIFNPYLTGVFVGGTSALTVPNPTAVTNPSPSMIVLLACTLSRILGTSCDNTVFFNGWLNGVNLNTVIPASLNQAFALLSPSNPSSPFTATEFPWGKGNRPIYPFINPVLGVVQQQAAFNGSGFPSVFEIKRCGVIRAENTMPLGQSGLVIGNVVNPPNLPPVNAAFLAANPPTFNVHNFDQQPLYTHFEMKNNPTSAQTACALNKGICQKCGSVPARGCKRSKNN
jgi:hypothetical protein